MSTAAQHMPRLIDTVDHGPKRKPVAVRERHARKVRELTVAEMFDPRLSRIYLSSLDEVPDRVKNHPPAVQWDYLRTYNNNLRRFGDVNYAMAAAVRAMNDSLAAYRAQQAQGVKA